MIRRGGQSYPLLMTAARIRSRASRSAVSGSPVTIIPGGPLAISASTSTMWASMPISAAQ